MVLETIQKYSKRAGKEAMAISEAAFLTMKDPKISVRQKAVLVGSLAYLLMPLDTIPDFLPGGFADDITLMLAAIASVGKVGKKHLQECRLRYGLSQQLEDDKIEASKETTPKS